MDMQVRREPIVVLDQIGDALPQSFPMGFLGRRVTPLTLPLPPPIAGPPQWWSKGVACIGIASPVGIGQIKHPQREWSCLDREDQRTLL